MLNVILLLWAVAVLAMSCRGIEDLVNMLASLRWLKQGGQRFSPDSQEYPFIILLLPVLREQRVIQETLRVLAGLKYPHERLRICVVTTEKELAQRTQAQSRLLSLAGDISSKRISLSLLIEKYLGLFSEDTLTNVISVAQHKGNEEEVRQYLFDVFQSYPTTIDLVKESIEQLNQQVDMPLFIHLHYPYTEGDVNQQLDYALQQMPACLDVDDFTPSTTYLAIYNADSRPHKDTLQLVSEMSHRYGDQHGMYPPAFQQSALFLENVGHLGTRGAGLVLQAAALLQSRWVLSHEIPRLRRQSRSAFQFNSEKLSNFQRLTGAEFALCVGHGFFLRYDFALRLELFTASNICDDFLWSYRLCIEHVPIVPLPLLESAESPITIKSLIIQKKSWFLGYTEYLRSRWVILQTKRYDRLTVELVTFYGLLHAFTWLWLSPAIFLAFIVPLAARSWPMFLITCAVYSLYGLLTYGILFVELKTLRNKSGGEWKPYALSPLRRMTLLFFSLSAFLLESVGLWWCIYQRIGWAITRKAAYREKTER
ncbi:MAG: glycosyltransferase family 2 protein [Ktedonobacteraceae bacterium]